MGGPAGHAIIGHASPGGHGGGQGGGQATIAVFEPLWVWPLAAAVFIGQGGGQGPVAVPDEVSDTQGGGQTGWGWLLLLPLPALLPAGHGGQATAGQEAPGGQVGGGGHGGCGHGGGAHGGGVQVVPFAQGPGHAGAVGAALGCAFPFAPGLAACLPRCRWRRWCRCLAERAARG